MFSVLQLEDFEEISFQLFYGVLYVEIYAFRTSGFGVIAIDVLGEYVAQQDFGLRQADGSKFTGSNVASQFANLLIVLVQ